MRKIKYLYLNYVKDALRRYLIQEETISYYLIAGDIEVPKKSMIIDNDIYLKQTPELDKRYKEQIDNNIYFDSCGRKAVKGDILLTIQWYFVGCSYVIGEIIEKDKILYFRGLKHKCRGLIKDIPSDIIPPLYKIDPINSKIMNNDFNLENVDYFLKNIDDWIKKGGWDEMN